MLSSPPKAPAVGPDLLVGSQTNEVSRPRAAILADLFKARLTALVLLTTALGYHFGTVSEKWGLPFWICLMGTGLLASGAAALNQYLERNLDARMERTKRRPLPAEEMEPGIALSYGVGLSLAGMLLLTFAVNPLTGFLGVITLVTYVFVYTPLKRTTVWNTVVGAIPGALPPMMGWTAATGELGAGGWSLFTILFFWQLPHFMAISWIYREDYAKCFFKMLSVTDPTGAQAGTTAVRHTLALTAFSLSPAALGLAGPKYAIGALGLGLAFLGFAVWFSKRLDNRSARALFLASIVYLPLVLGVLVADKRPAPPGAARKPAVKRQFLGHGGKAPLPAGTVNTTMGII